MRNIYLYLISIIGISLVACTNEELHTDIYEEEIISAKLPSTNSGTRALLDNLSVLWTAGDAISIFTENGTEYTNNKGTLINGARTSNADFSVSSKGSKTVAMYPYSYEAELKNGLITVVMPDKYVFTENKISSAPMAGIFTPGSSSVLFQNAGGLLGITVNNIPAGYNKAILSSFEEPIAGKCNITFNIENEPFIKAADESSVKTIEISFNESVGISNKTFYFPLPIGNYNSLNFSLSNGTEIKTIKTKALKVERGTRYRSEATLDELTGNFTIDVSGIDIANDSLRNGNNTLNIELLANDNTPEIVLPQSNGPTSLTFAALTSDNIVKISQTSGAAEVVHISASTETGSVNNFNIDLPQSTVTLRRGNFNGVTAKTADNTLIIEKNASVKSLDITGGNVRVYGSVDNIKSSSNIKIYVCEGGSVTSVDGNGIEIISENVEPLSDNGQKIYFIKTAKELKWIANFVNNGNTLEGWTVFLMNDIDLNNMQWTPIGYWQTFNGTFDGGDHTISNIKHHGTEEDCYVGLFGYTEDATVKNLKIKNVDIKLKGNASWAGGHVGALIGNIEGTTIVENIYVSGDVKIEGEIEKTGAGRIGGVIGGNSAKAYLRNIHIEATAGSYVKGNSSVGGIAGQLQGEAHFVDCSSNIEVTAHQFFAGGIVGLAPGKCTITNCSTSADISVTAGPGENDLYRVGGISGGWADNLNNEFVLEGCSYTGTLSGKTADNKIASTFYYNGFVGLGYSLIKGAKVIIDGTTYTY